MARRWVLVMFAAALSCRSPQRTAPQPKWIDPVLPTVTARKQGERPAVDVDVFAGELGAMSMSLGTSGPIDSPTPTNLSEAETVALLARLQPLPAVTEPAVMRPPSPQPPRTGSATPIVFEATGGKTIADVAPSPEPKKAPPPLNAPEIVPAGDVKEVDEILVRFDQPMVAVGETSTPTITITPILDGTWRWLDTRVAKFAPTSKVPRSTTFTVTVAAGARALSGAVLAAPKSVTFSTPTLQLVRVSPSYDIRPDSPLVVQFDQPVDASIAKHLRVTDSKKTPIAFETTGLEAAKTLWQRDPRMKLDQAKWPEHFVVIAPKTTWPAGLTTFVMLDKGAPSREGPRTTGTEQNTSFSIAKPFMLEGINCEGNRGKLAGERCQAADIAFVRFTNTIAKKSYRPEHVKLDGQPSTEGFSNSQVVRMTAPKEVGKAFTVTVSPDLVDELGQPFVGPTKATATTIVARPPPFFNADRGLYILDPRFEIPQWHVQAQAVAKIRVQLFAVKPSDYFAFTAFERDKRKLPPGKRVYDKTHVVGPMEAALARVDLRPALTNGVGHVIAIATASPGPAGLSDYERNMSAWIQVSKLGLTARFDGERLQSWAHRMMPGKSVQPFAGAKTSLLVEGRAEAKGTQATDAEGHAVFEFPPPKTKTKVDDVVDDEEKRHSAIVLLSSGDDSVFQAIDRAERSVRTKDSRWYITDDRFTYKPSEKVYVKGWVRRTHDGVNPDITLPAAGDTVKWQLDDSRDVKLAEGTTKLTPQGGFDLEVEVPKNANLGQATFTFSSSGDEMTHSIAIEEFRTPTFSVSVEDDVTHAGRAPLYAGEAIEMMATAKYYSGGGLAGAKAKWRATLSGAAYRPPNWDEFSFRSVHGERGGGYWRRYHRRDIEIGSTGYLSGASASHATIAIAALPDGEPAVLVAEATVTDVDRATIRDVSRAILVHPSKYYVGVRERSETEFEVIVTDVEGAPVSGVPIDVQIDGEEYIADEDDSDGKKVVDTQRCKQTSAATPVVCKWKRKNDKTFYNAVARVVDARGRANATRYFVPWYAPDNQPDELSITADRAQYRPGDVAKLVIHSETVPATAVVTFARQGVMSQKVIALANKDTTLDVPIEASFIRDLHVVVDRFTNDDGIPDHRSISTHLRLDPEHGRLTVVARALKAAVEPGAKASFEVVVRHRGKPVAGAEVALLVVDEAVLAVSEKSHADPLEPFYFDVEEGTDAITSLDLVRASEDLTKPPGFEKWTVGVQGAGYGVGGGRGGMRGRSSAVPTVSIGSPASVKMRKDFRATAVFSPKLITDANGKATVSVTMPDSLTRFRIVGLATAQTRYFGKGENTIVTQRSLNARTVAPRFLAQGDTFALPVIVQNLDTQPRTVDVAVRAANLIGVGPAGRRVTIAGGQRAELRFDFRTGARGKAVVQTIASSEGFADATQVEVPIRVPATLESFATYGVVDDKPQVEQLVVPKDIVAEAGGIEAELYATQLSNLSDAMQYLQVYPFECAEQRSSRMIANATMRDLLDAFAAPNRPTAAEIETQRKRDVNALLDMQNSDGGWGYWRNSDGDAYVTQQVVAALVLAGEKSEDLDRGIDAVDKDFTKLLSDLETAKTPKNPAYAIGLAAAELTTLAMVKRDKDRAQRLHAVAKKLGEYPIDAKARLLAIVAGKPGAAAMRKELVGDLSNRVREQAGSATISEAGDRWLLGSPTKTAALVMDAFIRESQAIPVIPKLARGILDARRRGRWATTQENLAVIGAMRRYFQAYESQTPAYTAKVWLGSAGYAEQAFAKRETRAATSVGWQALSGTTHDIAIAKAGAGRLYYRIGVSYAPKRIDTPPVDAGFVVRKSYTPLEDPSDVVRDANGNYKVKLGAAVQVSLELITTAPRFGVALVDPLPAGFEIVNTRLATSERFKPSSHAGDGTWEHVNSRDDRSEAFQMNMPSGTHRFSYVARATTPGTFRVAPAKAEEMYAPETFGRTSGTTVTIE